MEELDPKKCVHWHMMSYAIPQLGCTAYQSTIFMTLDNLVNVPTIQRVRVNQKIPDSAVVLSISYLAFANQHEFMGTTPEPEKPTETLAYLQGRVARLNGLVTLTENPYAPHTVENLHWSRGHMDEPL